MPMNTFSRRTLLGASVASLGLSFLPKIALAQEWDAALATTLTGTWQLAVSMEAARTALEAGITTAVAGLPPIVDGIAAGQIRDRTTISPRITLSVTQTEISSRFVHATFTSAPGAPTRVPVPGEDGATMEMVQLLRAGHFEQIFTTDSGRRWSTFTPAADGTRVTLDVVIHSDRLSTDVRFRLPYRRAT